MNTEIEIWKDIPGYEDFYQASSFGRVRSKSRLVNYSKGSRKLLRKMKGRILKPAIRSDTGYLAVILCINGMDTTIKIHRLVASSFIHNPENKRCVNHKDGNKLNNNLSNLEWVTHSENNYHAIVNRLKISHKMRSIIKYDLFMNEIDKYESINLASRMNKAANCYIRAVAIGEKESAYGFKWRYADGK
jgi:hypothetical protein